jgi:hypothetical protein
MSQGQGQEANLKAVFIYNFTKYIEWDTAANKNDFVIGIMGNSAITKSLLQIARTKTVKNKRIIVRLYNKPEEIDGCNILFIPKYTPHSLTSVLDNVDKGTLTVSEQPGYAKLGTAFNFILEGDKLRFEVNLRALNFSGLKAGSQLLKLANIVDQ